MTGYSKENLVQFLNFMAEKGLMKDSTVSSRKVAVNKVFSVLEETELSDLRKLNIDDVIQRFHNKNSMDVSPSTLRVYESRIKSSIKDFLNYKGNPSGFQPTSALRKTESSLPRRHSRSPDPQQVQSSMSKPSAQGDTNVFAVPIPVRHNLLVRVENLPLDLTHDEARKIAKVIEALAGNEEKQPTS